MVAGAAGAAWASAWAAEFAGTRLAERLSAARLPRAVAAGALVRRPGVAARRAVRPPWAFFAVTRVALRRAVVLAGLVGARAVARAAGIPARGTEMFGRPFIAGAGVAARGPVMPLRTAFAVTVIVPGRPGVSVRALIAAVVVAEPAGTRAAVPLLGARLPLGITA